MRREVNNPLEIKSWILWKFLLNLDFLTGKCRLYNVDQLFQNISKLSKGSEQDKTSSHERLDKFSRNKLILNSEKSLNSVNFCSLFTLFLRFSEVKHGRWSDKSLNKTPDSGESSLILQKIWSKRVLEWEVNLVNL